jgi:hypothetical protein
MIQEEEIIKENRITNIQKLTVEVCKLSLNRATKINQTAYFIKRVRRIIRFNKEEK